MKKIILLLVLINCNLLTAQNSLAKIEYSYAEEAYSNNDYKKALEHLEEVKSLLGSTNARVMYLEILSRSNDLPDYEEFSITFKTIKTNRPKSTESTLPYFYTNVDDTYLSSFINSDTGRETYINACNSLLTEAKTDIDIYMLTRYVYKLKNDQNLTKEDFNLEKMIEIYNETESPQINNWLESIEIISRLCDVYIQNFEDEAPIEKLKQIYEVKKQYKTYSYHKELVKFSWKALNDKDYQDALIKFKELESLGISSKQIIRKIKKIQVANTVVTSIEKNMVFVEGNQSEKEGISDLYVSKFEITSPQFFSIMNLDYEQYPPNFIKLIQNYCEDCPIRLMRNSAKRFIKSLNQLSEKKYRLPTKEEWFWFATGGVKTTDEERGKNKEKVKNIEEYAWFIKNTNNGREIKDPNSMIHQVGLKEPNELGLYDIWGNLAEFTTTNAVGGSLVTKEKKLVKDSNYTYSYDWDNEPINNNVIRLVLTADESKE